MDKLVVFLSAKMLCHSFKEMGILNLAFDGLQLHDLSMQSKLQFYKRCSSSRLLQYLEMHFISHINKSNIVLAKGNSTKPFQCTIFNQELTKPKGL